MMSGAERGFFKWAIAAWLVGLAGSVVYDRLTAQDRFLARLELALWELRQPGVERTVLSEADRARYLALLQSPEPASRWQAAAQLARWRDRESVRPLIVAMQDAPGTRRTCVMAQSLGAIGDPAAVPALLRALQHPDNLDLRVCATHALGDIGDPRAIEPLLKKAANRELREDDRASAILALGDMAFESAVPVLQRIHQVDPDDRFRTLAGRALHQIELLRPDDPAPGLIRELQSSGQRVPREWIIQRLRESWDSRAGDGLNEYLRGPGRQTPDAVRALALLLHQRELQAGTLEELETSESRKDRWMAQFAHRVQARQRTLQAAAGARFITNPPLP